VSGGAALLEGKSSSDGLTYVVTDSQGSLSIYGFGSSTDYLKVSYVYQMLCDYFFSVVLEYVEIV
jgi:hypothetical protein